MAGTNKKVAVDRNLPAAVVGNLARTGNDLGLTVRVVSEEEVVARIQPPKVSSQDRQQMAAMGTKMHEVAVARAAAADGRVFEGKYSENGLMLAGPSNPKRVAEQQAEIKAAPAAELQAVLRINSRKSVEHAGEELSLRFNQYLSNFPDKAAQLHDTRSGKTLDDNMAAARLEFGRLDYDKQRSLSKKNGMIVTLSGDKSRYLSSIRRGYTAISDELRSRGIEPEVSLTGKANSRKEQVEARTQGANALPQKPARLVRDGMELG